MTAISLDSWDAASIYAHIQTTTARPNSGCRPTFFSKILRIGDIAGRKLQVDIHFIRLCFGVNISSEIGGFETAKVSY